MDSNQCEIRANEIYFNTRGIVLESSSDCLVTENHIYNNTGVGISLDWDSFNNEIYENTFEHNSPNAICEGYGNHWDDQVNTGNSWSDYSGDGPYIIDEDDQDNFPIVDETTLTLPTTNGPGWNYPAILVGGVVIGIVALIIIIYDQRRIVVID